LNKQLNEVIFFVSEQLSLKSKRGRKGTKTIAGEELLRGLKD